MSLIVRLVIGHEEEPGLFIPFPRHSYDTKVLEAALPELREELACRWPVKEVKIRYRFSNPPPGVLATMIGTAEGLTVLFLTTAAVSGGHRFGKEVGKQMADIVNRWLKRLEPRKKKAGRSRKG